MRTLRHVGVTDWLLGLLITVGAQVLFVLNVVEPLRIYRAQVPPGPDDAARFVRISDLLAGQSWFDDTLYRMGEPGALVLHWSRLADLPVAGLALLLAPFVGEGEALVLVGAVWPVLLFAVLAVIVFALQLELAGRAAFALAGLVLVFTLTGVSEFVPGRIDHHGLGIMLIAATCLCLVIADRNAWAAFVAGAASALGPVISLELLPFSAVAIAAVGLSWAFGVDGSAALMRRFGTGLAVAAAAGSLIEIHPQALLAPACDAWSGRHALVFILAGSAFVALASNPFGSAAPRTRLTMLAACGGAGVGVAYAVLGVCVYDPMAGVPADVMQRWHNQVGEIESALTSALEEPRRMLPGLVPALAALLVASCAVVREHGARRRAWIIVLAFIIAALGLALVHQRNLRFVYPFVPLAAIWLFDSILRSERTVPLVRAGLAAATVFLFSGFLLALAGVPFVAETRAAQGGAARNGQADPAYCFSEPAYRALRSLPPGLVATPIDLGSFVLFHTGHRVISGPYHRNTSGLRAMLDLWGSPVTGGRLESPGAEVLAAWGVDYLFICESVEPYAPGDAGSLYASLIEGHVPEGLVVVARDASTGVHVFAVGRTYAASRP